MDVDASKLVSTPVQKDTWLVTPNGEPRGYISAHTLKELWFNTGTRCNLACDFCLEGSSPSDKRLQSPKLEEMIPYIDEALALGTEQFSFTGGEPMLIKDMVAVLEYASRFKPCMVLTNGTAPLLKRLAALVELGNTRHPIAFRVSLDSPDAKVHNMGRGKGQFEEALIGMRKLYQAGFPISVARHMKKDENFEHITQQYQAVFKLNGLPEDLNMVAFPDFLPPGSLPSVPHITEHCMTTYQTEEQRSAFMCASSRMIIKKDGEMKVYACTLVDDDLDYDLGSNLTASLAPRISLKHHRCYSCFAFGASCSEM
jgi:sulfatase maturation enzyme AslB (radical SAM superfamily)